MPEQPIVLGGWALKPQILAPCFGEDAVYIDINELMPQVVFGNALLTDWKDIIYSRVKQACGKSAPVLCGWSTGALLGFALAEWVRPKKLILISATPSFCRREGFPHGQKRATLISMREALFKDRVKTLSQFSANCGLPEGKSTFSDCPTEALLAGLVFLEQVNLL
ncbi:MAG: hypothetical protein PHC61_10870, partial [Chitinivibrionales bacterium]|nr:hypothetical protein [Chitinivibrionales bacterium]